MLYASRFVTLGSVTALVCGLVLAGCRVRGETTELFMKGSVAESSESVALDPVFLSKQKRVETLFFGFAPESKPAPVAAEAPEKESNTNAVVADKSEPESINIDPRPEYFEIRKSNYGNKLMWPVAGILTSKFGMRKGRLHAGIDIGAPKGQPIYASADGQVLTAKRKNGYGLVVILGHDNDHQTLYGHMSRIAAREGQFVRKGGIIGYVGMTGSATGNHVHFETRVSGGIPQNPLRFLPGGERLSKDSRVPVRIAKR